VSALPHITLAPSPATNVVSLEEWRNARRGPVEADVPSPAPLRLLRLVVDADEPPPFRLDVFLRRARAVMDDSAASKPLAPYRDAEPA
jgi:hypothetical protein